MFNNFLSVLVLVAIFSKSSVADQCFGESGNAIVIQAEHAPLTDGWRKSTALPGYSGSGYIKYVGEKQHSYQGKHVLKYDIVATGGSYRVEAFTARQGFDHCEWHSCNDMWLGVNNAEPKKLFSFFNHADDTWMWTWEFQVGHSNQQPYIQLPAGRSTIVIAGRSENFLVDRIAIFKAGTERPSSSVVNMVDCGGGGGSSGGGQGGGEAAAGPLCLNEKSWSDGDMISLAMQNNRDMTVRVCWIDDLNAERGCFLLEQYQWTQVNTFQGRFFKVMDNGTGQCVRSFRIGRATEKSVQIGQ